MAATATRTDFDATEPQINYLVGLATERGAHYDADARVLLSADRNGVIDLKALTKSEASNAINFFKSLPRPAKPAAQPTAKVELEEGMYQVGDDIYQVQKSKTSGKPYAKLLVLHYVTDEDGEVIKARSRARFEYAPGAIRRIRPEHRLPLDRAKAFGKRFGICCCCSRLLTNKISVDEGIGPICGGRI